MASTPAPRRTAPRTATDVVTAESPASRGTSPGKPPARYRVRVRMYRQGLGDCFLLSFPRGKRAPLQMLIDCGSLNADKVSMTKVVASIRDAVLADTPGAKATTKARLDVVVGTHEHKDHVSGFNQARDLFNEAFDIGSVWLAWTENLSEPEIEAIKSARRTAAAALAQVTAGPLGADGGGLADARRLLAFSSDDDSTGSRKVADAMEYLKLRGRDAGDLRFLEPGGTPMTLGDVSGVRVYVLGPPRDPSTLKASEVTEAMKRDGTVYHVTAAGLRGTDALLDAARQLAPVAGTTDRYLPFAPEHRVTRSAPAGVGGDARPDPTFDRVMGKVAALYDDPDGAWRRIETTWLGAFDQLALDLDNDTNNTSLVLAFEFEKTGEVLLFVADAQVGSWLSWEKVSFDIPGRGKPLPAHDLLRRTVFYKVGHHCSHNATLKKGGLELMTSEKLVAFIPLDRETAGKQGKDGWEMPAPALFAALLGKTKACVISDDPAKPSAATRRAGVVPTPDHVDYYLV